VVIHGEPVVVALDVPGAQLVLRVGREVDVEASKSDLMRVLSFPSNQGALGLAALTSVSLRDSSM
jgi:hypothetical protein